MSYQQFEALLALKLSLVRSLHMSISNKAVIQRNIAEIDLRLGGCPDYERYLNRYASTQQMVG